MKTKSIKGHNYVLIAGNPKGEIWVDETERYVWLYLKDNAEFNYGFDKKYDRLFCFRCTECIIINDLERLNNFIDYCNLKEKNKILYTIKDYLRYWNNNPTKDTIEALEFIFSN